MGHPRPLFSLFSSFNTQLTVNKCSISVFVTFDGSLSHLVARVRVALNSFRHKQSHFSSRGVADGVDEHPPRVLLLLPPAVRPAQDNRIGFHAAQASRLNPERTKDGIIRGRGQIIQN